MARPRKRKRVASANTESTPDPMPKKKHGSQSFVGSKTQHPVLSQFYPHVQTLREYVIAKLPPTSRIRRRKISAMGIANVSPDEPISGVERSLGVLLDTTFVGLPNLATQEGHGMEGWKNFSQRGDESYVTLSNGVAGFTESQAQIVEYVIRTIFNRDKSTKWPDHLLCDGFRRNGGLGLRAVRPNDRVAALQQSPWPELLALLGESGDRIMIDLLLDCAIFVSVKVGVDNVCQISGKPLSSISPYCFESVPEEATTSSRSPSELIFVRNRMLYARAALNARGQVHFGLRHIHVLNRSPILKVDEDEDMPVELKRRHIKQNDAHTLRVMMYMFPRQLGLHNVFTSKVDLKETSQRLKDYTLREEEILEKFGRLGDDEVHVKIPKRLRGRVKDLVRKFQVLHQRCSYSKLLRYYCPVQLSTNDQGTQVSDADKSRRHSRKSRLKAAKKASQPYKTVSSQHKWHNCSITDLATSHAEVSSFCQAVFRKVIPQGFWGRGLTADHNEKHFLKQVNRFISLRRFENMSLNEVVQGLKVSELDWLAPPQLMANRTSLTDMHKRLEILNEFLYFLFDSILIPLVRSNFYATESNTDKYRIFFFRHDVWRSLMEPAMAGLRGKMLEEVSLVEAHKILDSRKLGFGHIRLLPKGTQMRPIANLRKRIPIRGNPKELGPGVNKILAPAHTVLQLEKILNPQKLGSTMFSVSDIYKRVKPFKSRMAVPPRRFYFAKVDVQSAFDTIPQAAIVGLLDSIPQQRRYRVSKYLEVGASHAVSRGRKDTKIRPVKRWPSVAIKNDDPSTFIQHLENGHIKTKRNGVFVDLYQRVYESSELLQLVASHIQQNLVKIGKKYYRQKNGIPQGSILSSTLCNYFYADLELHVLPFLGSDDCLLLRLIDDFLLITTDRSKAVRFVETLHRGVPEYGVTVNPRKSLVNFDLVIDGQEISKLDGGRGFPYCGTMIDTITLDIARAPSQDQDKGIYNSLTVEFCRNPGQTFQRKVLNAFKIQSHIMFFDTGLNSASTMLKNVHKAFTETATKMWAYARCLPTQKQPSPKLITSTIQKLVDTAYMLLVSKTRKLRYPGYVCDVKKCEVSWLAYNAFRRILERKQSNYKETLAWLKMEMVKLSLLKDIRHGRVRGIV